VSTLKTSKPESPKLKESKALDDRICSLVRKQYKTGPSFRELVPKTAKEMSLMLDIG